jgi:iron complex outermembrane recepter protein
LVPLLALGILIVFTAVAVVAQEEPRGPSETSLRLEAVQVTATRSAESIATVPGSVTVMTREQLEDQATLSQDFGEILGKLLLPP